MVTILNKKEKDQTILFLSVIADLARDILDEVAEFEAVIESNKKEQHYESMQRAMRKKRARERRVAVAKR